ncbi:MAG: glutamyl-tRNA reductase [Phycisphaera sp.]|nr:glutamyl-tRNA reductase [Phycisphaera sp.]
MHLICVGISHKTAPVELRERVALNADGVADALRELHTRHPAAEIALVSTCNRTEFYTARPLHGHPRVDELVEFLAAKRDVDIDRLTEALYHHDNDRAIRHLMRVSAGLESMVIGEGQIIGQVREAYDVAQQVGSVGGVLHKVFQNALAIGKRVRTETEIGSGRTSVASVAVDFARHVFRKFDDKTLLVIGAGKMTELTLRHFRELNPQRVLVCNRSADKAEAIVAEHGGEVAPFEKLDDHLVEADIVISSTGSRDAIVTADRFKPLLKRRRFRNLYIIDIAVPRDFEPAVGELANVWLHDLDDLQRAIAGDAAARNGQVGAAESIIEPAVAQTYESVQTGDLNDLIRRLRQRLHDIGASETQRTLGKLRDADPDTQAKLLDELSHRLVNKILHRPLSELNRTSAMQSAMYATALRRLFELDALDAEDLDTPETNRVEDDDAGAE